MRITLIAVAMSVSAAFMVPAAVALDAPEFYQNSCPEHALGPAMEWDKALKGAKSPLDAKTMELISIAVAAQIPCRYCSFAYIRAARGAGATEAEIKQAVAITARIRL